ncbi:transglutaminase family protein [Halosquirtibacter laminarini]|uniref:Transglutaminase family protein n=1 Tax=Halosquirtibacter laminarini TaxID=3374600 RepID=A0AC61NPD1_9BACT|nr:transglutaminase family protein [Prolixibacteraceae bacterium]
MIIILKKNLSSYSELRLKAERIRALKPEVVPEPKQTISEEVTPKVILPSPSGVTPPMPLVGDLIQTGGRVGVLSKDILIDLDIAGDNIKQIFGIRHYIIDHWHYIHDPEVDKDTWRSADVTIQLCHKGKFPGDCDDFAILMASLAKQIGLNSRVVGGYSHGSGHAFAEFLSPRNYSFNSLVLDEAYSDSEGLWISLDWFSGKDHNDYNNNRDVILKD